MEIVLYPFLPNDLPMQWVSDGSVNYTLPNVIGLCVIPLISLFLTSYARGNDMNIFRGVIVAWLFTFINIGTLVYIAFIM